MKDSGLLVFTTCYNEHDNIGRLLDEIVKELPEADILVVDDSSPDGTWDIIQERCRIYPQLTAVQRPRKLGIGGAHKYALFYAMREGYQTLITMDADFSHDPKHLQELLAAHGPDTFVTGSRYCEGGISDYKGYRDIVSRFGNTVARAALGVRLRELTTYYRVFDVNSLRRIPLRRVKAAGYSYGVQLIYFLRKAGVKLREVPIHFVDRTHGASKIPRIQIIHSALDLVALASRRLFINRDLTADEFVDDACANCGDRALAMKHRGASEGATGSAVANAAAYRCTSAGVRSYPAVYTCLRCGLEQVPASRIPQKLEALYGEVSDKTYLGNIEVRKVTFARLFDQIKSSLPEEPGTMLEVGAYCGLFMREAIQRGWHVDGIEPSAWAAQYARDTIGVNVRTGFLADNADKLQRKYDVVVSWDVLEHVRDPLQFTRECAGYLNSGGMFCFSSLDVATWFPRLTGRRWPWLMDMHLHYFDRHVIADMMKRAGLELLRAEPYAHYASVGYALRGATRLLPRVLEQPFTLLAKCIPSRFMLPVTFGDIKVYVARKK